MLDPLLTLSRDTFVYKELIEGLKARSIAISNSLRNKTFALFADVCSFIPILKYASNVSWGESIFGPDGMVQPVDSLFSKEVPLHDILESLEPVIEKSWPFKYKIADLLDPVLFNEFLNVMTRLKPSEIAWLSTHRTLGHTQRCTLQDFKLWKIHMERIFERLPSAINAGPLHNSNLEDAFSFEVEIGQAAKDIKQVLIKIQNYNNARRRQLINAKLAALSKSYPIALMILDSIDAPTTVNPIITARSRARRVLTTVLRLCLCDLGLANDKRIKKRPALHYVNQLENLLALTSIKGKAIEDLRTAVAEKDVKKAIAEIENMFQFLMKPEDFQLWTEISNTLDRWLKDK